MEVGAVAADLHTVDALARLQLAAGRLGRRARLRSVSPDLAALIGLCGLGGVLLGLGGEAEQREQPLGVEERVQPRDPPA